MIPIRAFGEGISDVNIDCSFCDDGMTCAAHQNEKLPGIAGWPLLANCHSSPIGLSMIARRYCHQFMFSQLSQLQAIPVGLYAWWMRSNQMSKFTPPITKSLADVK